MLPSVLIVEDEAALAEALRTYLAGLGYEVAVVDSGEAALESVPPSEPDLVLLDFRLPGMDGLDTLRSIKNVAPSAEVVMVTAYATVKSAVAAMRAGAFDYLTKPVDLEELAVVLDRAWQHARLHRELRYWQESGRQGNPLDRIVGASTATAQLRRQIQRLAEIEREQGGAPPVLITGETGTGKGLAARAIHDLSARAIRPFVDVHCATIPAALLEAELFGYERGAYTDARTAKAGLFEIADGGTLFLDEIGAMPLDLQAKLLKAIEDRSIRRLGGLRPKPVDLRIIAATNVDLEAATLSGSFRADLFYRLKVLTLAIPPLRDRPEDILALAHHFLAQAARQYRRDKRLHPDVEAHLLRYSWPGNVRELSNVIERAVLLHDGEEVLAQDLGLEGVAPAGGRLEVRRERIRVDFSEGVVSLAEVEGALIRAGLEAADGNRGRAAELLGITLETLRYRMQKHGIPRPPAPGRRKPRQPPAGR